MKAMALYLPAFHRIPENDRWWGEGFTEWDNTKKGTPLYKGHNQPLVPFHHNYYDLTDVDTLKWQAATARKYHVSGFILYHYWFNGRLLLEKPVELFLEHKEIDIEFCLCLANESWARTWDGKDTELFMKQEYGEEEDWERHFQYYLPFFMDQRYVKNDGKPVLFIYSLGKIKRYDDMVKYWNRRAVEEGLKGIYLVEMINTFNPGRKGMYTSAVCEFEPHSTCRNYVSVPVRLKRVLCKKIGLTDYLDYDYVWRQLLKKNTTYGDCRIIRSAFVNFDNSPRKGRKSFVIKGAAPQKFSRYLNQLIQSGRKNLSSDYLVINAWNEWGEGAVLEPTEHNKFGYLEAVRNNL